MDGIKQVSATRFDVKFWVSEIKKQLHLGAWPSKATARQAREDFMEKRKLLLLMAPSLRMSRPSLRHGEKIVCGGLRKLANRQAITGKSICVLKGRDN